MVCDKYRHDSVSHEENGLVFCVKVIKRSAAALARSIAAVCDFALAEKPHSHAKRNTTVQTEAGSLGTCQQA